LHQNGQRTCGNFGHKGQNDKFVAESQVWEDQLNVGQLLLLKNFSISPIRVSQQRAQSDTWSGFASGSHRLTYEVCTM